MVWPRSTLMIQSKTRDSHCLDRWLIHKQKCTPPPVWPPWPLSTFQPHTTSWHVRIKESEKWNQLKLPLKAAQSISLRYFFVIVKQIFCCVLWLVLTLKPISNSSQAASLPLSEAWLGVFYSGCTRAAPRLWNALCCRSSWWYDTRSWKGSGSSWSPRLWGCILTTRTVKDTNAGQCSLKKKKPNIFVKCFSFFFFWSFLYFPAELVAAVQYFDQRQAQAQQQTLDLSEEVRERLAFLELQAQVRSLQWTLMQICSSACVNMCSVYKII